MPEIETEVSGPDASSVKAKPEPASLDNRIVCFAAMGFILRLTQKAFWAIMLFAFVAAVLAGFNDLPKYPIFNKFVVLERSVETPVLEALRRSVPTNFRGSNVAAGILFGFVFVFSFFFGIWGDGLIARAAELRVLREMRKEEIKAVSGTAPPQAEVKLGRKDLLEIYARTKKSLEEHKVKMAFLSIDVVNSTGMKAGEEPGIAERDFRHYKRLVVRALSANNVLKSAWTPDGVMAGFKSVPEAVSAAQTVIADLKKFNSEVKTIKAEFAVRAGINAGEVFCDETTPMAEMTDMVIDIAGHMQKYGCVNGIAIPKSVIEPLLGEFRFADAARVVDKLPVYEWKPEAAPRA